MCYLQDYWAKIKERLQKKKKFNRHISGLVNFDMYLCCVLEFRYTLNVSLTAK